MSYAWDTGVTLDVERIMTAENAFRSNPIKVSNVVNLKRSFTTHGVAEQAASKTHAVVFLGKFYN